jgi:energy-coupling factor transporter transmembrane protein EcfT
MQIIPEMSKQAATIMDAQKTRGVETEGNVLVRAKAFLPSLGPLVLSSLSSTEERAITLEARAFSAPVKKTHMFELPKTQRDKAIECGLIFLLILLVAGRLLL